MLAAPDATAAELTAAAATLRDRLARLGADTDVEVRGGDLVLDETDPFVVEAVARREPTRIVAIDAVRVGECRTGGVTSYRRGSRCYTLGADIVGVEAVESSAVGSREVDGFGVDVVVGSEWEAWRDALDPRVGDDVAVVAGGRVLVATRLSVPALATRIGGQMSEADARRVATALTVADSLPVELEAPETPAVSPPSERDVWLVALTVRVCGRVLPPAPSFSEVGVHSHSDGMIYIHSLPPDPPPPTLGDFLDQAGVTLDDAVARFWDGTEVRAGAPCPRGGRAEVHWRVDGRAGTGAPRDHVLAPAEVIEIDVGPAPEGRVGTIPDRLPTPIWGPGVT